ncbi:glycosyltransferase [Pseudocnuella soli]|uniref:glycosyltransferase n=1 Tax=Pseudocnuella soli TaxID=2502779 RepID=UPI0010479D6E|nr:glycosyltransferase [Pseudocnuella soli]
MPDTGSGKKKVLVAPLDWGLGHTTRVIPIIHSLLQRGHQVCSAGNSQQKSLLQAEFPQLTYLPLAGYGIKYGVSAVQTAVLLLRQIPQIWAAIEAEKQWLAQSMAVHSFDAVISDNRYGMYHPKAHCTIITHQLRIQAPVAAGVVQRIHFSLLQKFNACWVPDVPGAPGLAGALSHPHRLPAMPLRYLGPLSRFSTGQLQPEQSGLLVLLSGPEPQRTLFENILLPQLSNAKMPVTLVRGLPGSQQLLAPIPGVQVFNHLPTKDLQEAMQRASLVVCRSGYSSVMDLAALCKRSIVVPTPGQTEQAYLARHLHQSGFALAQQQQGFDLKKALEKAAHFAYHFPEPSTTDLLAAALDEWEANASSI